MSNQVKKIFNQSGNIFQCIDEPSFNFHDELPPGTYSMRLSMEGYYLERRDDFDIKHKIYGSANRRADRIINSFNERSGNTGVILRGEKGSGKTLLAKIIAERFVNSGYVALLINEQFHGEGFNAFLSNIKQPCVVIFDEFEKVYPKEKQSPLLTTFDGMFPSKKLFIVTVNDFYGVNDFFKDRPGRFLYSYAYAGLEEDFIREYCEENLNDKSNINGIVVLSSTFTRFNFDMLKSLVEEMNRYNESVSQSLEHLNISPMEIVIPLSLKECKLNDNKEIIIDECSPLNVNPYRSFYYIGTFKGKKDEDNSIDILIDGSKDLVSMRDKKYHYKNDQGEFMFERVESRKESSIMSLMNL